MAVARSIFTLGGGFQLFCAAFDMPMRGVALKVALGYKKIVFWLFQKNIHDVTLDTHLPDYFLNTQKTNFLCPNATFNGTTVTGISKQLNPTTKVNIK